MAKLTALVPLAPLVATLLLVAPRARAADLVVPPDAADAKAVDAFRQYFNAFDAYEEKTLHQGEKSFQKSWEDVKRAYQKDQAKLSVEQLETLEQAAQKYRQHLEEHPTADNRPYVMLNLAQIQNMIGDHLAKSDPNAGTSAKSEALALLKDIETNFRDFPQREQALYLRAVVLESMDRQDEAFAAWQALAATAHATIYGVHAGVATGDHLFMRERAAEAVVAYQRALDLLPDVNADDPDYERLRINYRLAWAAYRAAELNTVIKATAYLLSPDARIKSVDQREKIHQDGIDLTGDALYENNNFAQTKAVLTRKEIVAFAPAVGLRTLQRYNANGIHPEAVRLGEYLIGEFPLAKELPDILQTTADSYDKLGQTPKRIALLEQMAMLLPAQSLWRSRHKDDLQGIKAMEDRATKAAVVVATYHYDTGLASGNLHSFDAASSYYDILIDHAGNAAESNEWRLKRAHCQFFAGNYDEAARLYSELKTDFKVDPEILQVASYQLVLTDEKRWRDIFAKAGEKGANPLQDDGTKAALKDLEKAIDEFAARFPTQSRAVDLLLVGAAANRDMEQLDQASKYWQRALVSQPTPAQRGVAIRGLVFASMKTGSAGDVVELTRRFLKLEDWRALGLNLGTELEGVLSVAALDEGKRLNDSGKVLEAGTLMVQIATEFPAVPDRERLFRDGAYMLAIAGSWAEAQKAADDYMKSGLTRNKGDMLYLLARAHEYQLRLHEAAKAYFELGDQYPRHSRAVTSLQRAEKLAAAESDFDLAAQAAAAQAEIAKTQQERLDHYSRAVDYLDKAQNPDKALAIARRRLRTSRTLAEKMSSQLLVARMNYRAGSEREALDDLAILSKQIERNRARLGQDAYAALAGETNYLLGEEARRQFEDFRILERSGGVAKNVAQKLRYFEDLVQSYDRAAAAGDPKWATRSRFELARSAEALADEIASIPARTDEALTLKSRSRYNATIERLQAMARKYYSSNVLAARSDPARFKGNEWVKKSALRLTGETSDKPETRHQDVMPASLQDNLPSDWSL